MLGMRLWIARVLLELFAFEVGDVTVQLEVLIVRFFEKISCEM